MFALALAHQGGWDELGIMGLPILAFGAILVVANRRAAAADTTPVEETSSSDE